MDLPVNQIICGDCLEVMKELPDKSIDMILCDLPYGTTACKWDSIIPFEPLWEQYERIIKDNGAIVLFGSQPFTTKLVESNLKLFKYELIWIKSKPTGFINAQNAPLKKHENILIFSKGATANKSKRNMKYFPQGLVEINKPKKSKYDEDDILGTRPSRKNDGYIQKFTGYPSSILEFKSEGKTIHPTQKPVALFEYLIKTYTQPGEIVLDNCIGSGTTAIAALNTGRFFIGIEKEEKYVEIARKRIAEHVQQLSIENCR
jgi:site-specific DNA-methyltransferase (adenine-specific)